MYMPPRKYSGPLLPGQRSTKKTETRKQRATRLKKTTVNQKSFNKAMTAYNSKNVEKKIILYRNYTVGPDSTFEGHLPAVGLSNTGQNTNDVTAVVTQTGYYLTTDNTSLNTDTGTDLVTAVGGYDIQQGAGNNELVGKFGKITSSFQNFWIQMNPQTINSATTPSRLEATMPHRFRVIQVKEKGNNAIPNTVGPDSNALSPKLSNNLFLSLAGEEVGLTNDFSALELFDSIINKSKWTVLKDTQFTLCANTVFGAAAAYPTSVKQHPSMKHFRCYYPKPKGKTRWSFQTGTSVSFPQPVDYDYVVHTIILCRVMGGLTGYESNNWSVQTNGHTVLIDE